MATVNTMLLTTLTTPDFCDNQITACQIMILIYDGTPTFYTLPDQDECPAYTSLNTWSFSAYPTRFGLATSAHAKGRF
jgi:hypothetical protein